MIEEIIKNIQNPAIGSYLLWNTIQGYCGEINSQQMPLYVSFFVLPFLINERIYNKVTSTQKSSSIYKLIHKLDSTEFTLLKDSITNYYSLTCASVGLGVRTGLMNYNKSTASITPNTCEISISSELSKEGKQAQKLGKWFSEITLSQLVDIIERG